jgi:hypothetical protein
MCGNLPDEREGEIKYKGAMKMKGWIFYFCTYAVWCFDEGKKEHLFID